MILVFTYSGQGEEGKERGKLQQSVSGQAHGLGQKKMREIEKGEEGEEDKETRRREGEKDKGSGI